MTHNIMSAPADHILHFRPDRYGGVWRLECLPGDEHFTVNADENGMAVEFWSGSAAELEAQGYEVNREHCWVHDWIDWTDHPEEWMVGDDWPEDGPWPVVCSFDGDHMDVEFAGPALPSLRERLSESGINSKRIEQMVANESWGQLVDAFAVLTVLSAVAEQLDQGDES